MSYYSSFKDELALFLGKLTHRLSPRSTSLPGYLALKVSSGLLKNLLVKTEREPILVTGTNGKSTTTGLINHLLLSSGQETLSNSLGANLSSGILTTLLQEKKLAKKQPVLEADEAFLQKISQANPAKLILVSNFFRDQLDRFGEINNTVEYVQAGLNLCLGGNLVLNGDDPQVCKLKVQSCSLNSKTKQNKIYYYGFEAAAFEGKEEPEWQKSLGEQGNCPVCQKKLFYQKSWLGQMGLFACQSCQFKKPTLQIRVKSFQFNDLKNETEALLAYQDLKTQEKQSGEFLIRFNLPGLFNLYNVLAACAACLILGIKPEAISHGLSSYRALFGRSQLIEQDGVKILLSLIKNPLGTEEVLRSISQKEKAQKSPLLILINDNYADGRDISF